MPKIKNPQHFLIGLAYCSLFSLGLIDNIRGPFLPELNQDLALNGTTSAMYFSFTSMFSFLGSSLSPLFLRRGTSLQLMMLSGLILAAGFSVIAFSHYLPVLLIGSSVIGVAFGTLSLSHNLLISEAASPAMKRRLYSGLHSMYGLAALTAPMVASGFRWFGVDWRGAFLALCALPLLVAGVAFPRRRYVHESMSLADKPKLSAADLKFSLIMALVVGAYLWGEISSSTRMVAWLRLERGFSPDEANVYLAAFFALLLLGRLLCTFYHLPWRNETVLRLSALSSGVLFGLGLAHDPAWMIFSATTMAPFFPIAMDYITEHFGKKSSSALSLILGVSSLSVVLMHTCIGALTDWRNMTYGLWVGPAGLFAIVLLFWPGLFGSQRVTKK